MQCLCIALPAGPLLASTCTHSAPLLLLLFPVFSSDGGADVHQQIYP